MVCLNGTHLKLPNKSTDTNDLRMVCRTVESRTGYLLNTGSVDERAVGSHNSRPCPGLDSNPLLQLSLLKPTELLGFVVQFLLLDFKVKLIPLAVNNTLVF